MIIVDDALRRREAAGEPIRIGLVGAGAMGRALMYQVRRHVPGMEVVALANRTVETAVAVCKHAGWTTVEVVDDLEGLAASMERAVPAVTDDPSLLCRAAGIDAIWEVTGAVEFGCHVALDAIANHKHVITMNAEMQGTVGPVLKARGDEAGVVVTDSDGDQPGVMMNLHRFVQGLGVRPVLLGNLKGLHDTKRNPTTQTDFARRRGLTPHMAASFADGTKMSFEMALVANATGLRAGKIGLHGFAADHVHDAARLFPLEQLLEIGLVDYLVGAEPAPGVFCLGTTDEGFQQRWLELYKLGDGPLYTFYSPYHLCHLEAPTSVARAVLFGDATVAPDVGHVVDVVATAKRPLSAGQTLDGIGWYDTYGQCVNADESRAAGLLPIGLAEGCRVIRNIAEDRLLAYDDVEVPDDRLVDRLRTELPDPIILG